MLYEEESYSLSEIQIIEKEIERIQSCYTLLPYTVFGDPRNIVIEEYLFDPIVDILDVILEMVQQVKVLGGDRYQELQAKAERQVYILLDSLESNVNIMRDMGVTNMDEKFLKLERLFFEGFLHDISVDDLKVDVSEYTPKIQQLIKEHGEYEPIDDNKALAEYYNEVLDDILCYF